MSTETDVRPESPHAYIREVAPRMVILAILCLIVQGLMGLSYMGAFGKPDVKGAPFLVVSSTNGNAGYIANKLNDTKNQPVTATISTDLSGALTKVKHGEAVGVYVFKPTKTGKQVDDLYYGSGQGASQVQVAQTVANQIAKQGNRQLQSHDILPTAGNDPRGTAPFYLVLAWLVGGYLLPSAMSTVVGMRARTAIGARLRLLLFVGYALVSGLAGTFLAQGPLDALNGSYWKISLLGAAVVFTVATVTYCLTSLLGTVGIGVAIILFVILGNPSSGGAFAYDILPEPWRTVGPYLPNGAGVDAVRSLSYYGGVNLGRPLWVLLVWTLVGLWVLFMVGNNTYRFAPDHVGTADASGLGVVGDYVEEHVLHMEIDPKARERYGAPIILDGVVAADSPDVADGERASGENRASEADGAGGERPGEAGS